MTLSKHLMLAVYRVGSHVVYGSTAEANWIYEKIQRPSTCLSTALNLYYWKRGIPKIHRIISLLVEPVFDCNLHCVYCPWVLARPRLEGLRPRLMDWDIFRKAIDGIPASVETVQLAGLGEPTLHPKIADMVEYIANAGKRTILFSNCTMLRGDLLKRLADTRLTVLTVSGEPDAETCKQYRGVNLDMIRSNIEAFRAAKRPETEVKLRIVAHPGNVDLLGTIKKNWGDIFDDIKVCPRFDLEGVRSNAFLCMEPWRGNINVWTDGNVSPCCLDGFEDLTIGNLAGESLGDIIRGHRYRELLGRMVKGAVPARCMTCTDVQLDGVPSLLPSLAARSERRAKSKDVRS